MQEEELQKEGILKGMNDYMATGFKELKQFNAKEFNDKAIQEFYELFKN